MKSCISLTTIQNLKRAVKELEGQLELARV